MKIKFLENLQSSCPSQWKGETEDGETVYIRYRWGYLSVDIGINDSLEKQAGDSFDGTMSNEEIKEHLDNWKMTVQEWR